MLGLSMTELIPQVYLLILLLLKLSSFFQNLVMN
jgi:hypothetical protein